MRGLGLSRLRFEHFVELRVFVLQRLGLVHGQRRLESRENGVCSALNKHRLVYVSEKRDFGVMVQHNIDVGTSLDVS